MKFFQRNAVRFAAIMIVAVFYFLSRQPDLSSAGRNRLAEQFAFERIALTDENASLTRNVREVAPSLQHISGWISSVGAGIALNDLDGDGLSNDFCKVDPRTDNVLVAPVPQTGERFTPFTLDGGALVKQKLNAPMGCIPNDYNEDGINDILVYYWGRTPIVFLARQTGNSPFIPSRENYAAQETVPGGERWFSGAATVTDLDGDSHLDIVIGNYFQDEAEILDAGTKNRQTMQHSMSRAFNGGKSRILRWQSAAQGENPSVRFERVEDYVDGAEARDVMHGWTLAIAACDLDRDLLPELYFANDFGKDRLLYNRSTPGNVRFSPLSGVKDFTTPSSKIVGRDSFKGMGVDFADVNRDGAYDFFVSNIAAIFALEESHFLFLSNAGTENIGQGIVPYSDRSEELGVSRSNWGWDVKFGDFNNDGEQEIIQAVGFLKGKTNRWAELHEIAMGNDQLLSDPANWHKFLPDDDLSGDAHNPFYARASDGRFYDIAPQIKTDRRQITRGIATADVNADGKLDFAISNQYDTSFLFINTAQNAGNFLGLNLRIPLNDTPETLVQEGFPTRQRQSRAAIGAQVSVTLPDGKKMISFVDGGNGHSGKRSPELMFGLGNLPKDEPLQIEIIRRGKNGQKRAEKFEMKSGWQTVYLSD